MLLLDRILPVRPPVSEPFTVRPVPQPDLPHDEYRQVARRIGFSVPVPRIDRSIEFENTLSEMGVRQYPENRVRTYLNIQYGRVRWGWRSLRKQDYDAYASGKGVFMAADKTLNDSSTWWDRRHNGQIIGNRDAHIYDKPVPYPVLLTVERIAEKFPEAHFFVNDEARSMVSEKVLDPFLMVVIGTKRYIIERWDEPKFRP